MSKLLKIKNAKIEEYLTVNQRVSGSSPEGEVSSNEALTNRLSELESKHRKYKESLHC
jgi:hypothetical protein